MSSAASGISGGLVNNPFRDFAGLGRPLNNCLLRGVARRERVDENLGTPYVEAASVGLSEGLENVFPWDFSALMIERPDNNCVAPRIARKQPVEETPAADGVDVEPSVPVEERKERVKVSGTLIGGGWDDPHPFICPEYIPPFDHPIAWDPPPGDATMRPLGKEAVKFVEKFFDELTPDEVADKARKFVAIKNQQTADACAFIVLKGLGDPRSGIRIPEKKYLEERFHSKKFDCVMIMIRKNPQPSCASFVKFGLHQDTMRRRVKPIVRLHAYESKQAGKSMDYKELSDKILAKLSRYTPPKWICAFGPYGFLGVANGEALLDEVALGYNPGLNCDYSYFDSERDVDIMLWTLRSRLYYDH